VLRGNQAQTRGRERRLYQKQGQSGSLGTKLQRLIHFSVDKMNNLKVNFDKVGPAVMERKITLKHGVT
jgi:hypothetical protein